MNILRGPLLENFSQKKLAAKVTNERRFSCGKTFKHYLKFSKKI
jgi:hypothetical protein